MSWEPIKTAYVFFRTGEEAIPVGRLKRDDAGFWFTYSCDWLESSNAFSIDPINLPLSEQNYFSRKCWGAFLDAGPDNWGRRVILATHRQAPSNEIEWLIVSKGAGVGALTFSASREAPQPTTPAPDFTETFTQLLELEGLFSEGDIAGIRELPREIQKAFGYGSSMGGARPKFNISRGGKEWICKLNRSDDIFNQPIAEMACLNMATAVGINTPARELIPLERRYVLMVERFDRSPHGTPHHYLSAHALAHPIRVREGDPESPLSYIALTEIIRQVSESPQEDLQELFTRMILNVAIGNTDDHLKNHGFLHAYGEKYRLAPAFDILPHPDQTALMALAIGSKGREASMENALTMASRFGLSHPEAINAIDRVFAITQRAKEYYMDAGASRLDAELLHQVSQRKKEQFDAYMSAPGWSGGYPSP